MLSFSDRAAFKAGDMRAMQLRFSRVDIMKRITAPECFQNPIPKPGPKRRDVLKTAAYGGAALMAAGILGTAGPAFASQQGWRMCSKCLGSFRTTGTSVCPFDHAPHTDAGTHQYTQVTGGTTGNSTSGDQGGWRHCTKCSGLFYAVATGNHMGVCPAGGTHNSGTVQLAVQFGVPAAAHLEADWRWCGKCMGLWHSTGPTGACPAGGGHIADGSGQYVEHFV